MSVVVAEKGKTPETKEEILKWTNRMLRLGTYKKEDPEDEPETVIVYHLTILASIEPVGGNRWRAIFWDGSKHGIGLADTYEGLKEEVMQYLAELVYAQGWYDGIIRKEQPQFRGHVLDWSKHPWPSERTIEA